MEREDFNGMNLDQDISDEDFKEIVEIYEQIKDRMSKEDFIAQFNENKESNLRKTKFLMKFQAMFLK